MFENSGTNGAELLIFLFLVFCIPAIVVASEAGHKGKSSAGYFFLSLIFTPIIGALILAAATPNKAIMDQNSVADGSSRWCPRCREAISIYAGICRHCHMDINPTIEAEKTTIKDLLASQTSASQIARQLNINTKALEKRVQYYFSVKNIKAVGVMAQKRELK